MSERNHMICNSIARTEGRLAKVITVLDSAGAKAPPDIRFVRALTEASEITESMYPQMQRAVVLTNAPWFITAIINFVKPLISKRAGKKLIASRGGFEACPMLSQNVSVSALPRELGGAAVESLRQTLPAVVAHCHHTLCSSASCNASHE